MLARVAENLYWTGRYIERAEYCTRYLKVQFFSSLDAHMAHNKDFVMRSILYMMGSDLKMEHDTDVNDIWHTVLFEASNPSSIFSLSNAARENIRGIRNNISTELWESINRWYLYCKNRSNRPFTSADIYSFADSMTNHFAMIKSTLVNTLLHNDTWHFIRLGIFLEKVLQILRILRSKVSDATILSDNGVNKAELYYQWTILLKSLEAFDIHRSLYKFISTPASIFELTISNEIFPRSVRFATNQFSSHLTGISVRPDGFISFYSAYNQKLEEFNRFYHFGDEEKVVQHIEDMYSWFSTIHFSIEKLYFK